MRVAAVGDVHYDINSRNRLRPYFEALEGRADILMIAGDLTQHGTVEEAMALADDLKNLPVPVVSILGNHDYHSDQQEEIHQVLRKAGVITLEGETAELLIRGQRVGIMGLKGFGGGFGGACVTEFGEPETKAFARHAKHQADLIRSGLKTLDTDYRFVLLHYSPVESTLLGEKKEIFPFLGSYLLAEAIDAVGADGVFHGHAHLGTERGSTPGGVPVRNVAQMVIRHAYNVYSFEKNQSRIAESQSSSGEAPGIQSHL
ncbi:MAG: metallophosphoesterase [Methylotenera sp.]|nr:metallophosphoesterase [Oligoflexia bacterium]